jgi:hypothetical protein
MDLHSRTGAGLLKDPLFPANKQKLIANCLHMYNSPDGLAETANPFVRDEQAKS